MKVFTFSYWVDDVVILFLGGSIESVCTSTWIGAAFFLGGEGGALIAAWFFKEEKLSVFRMIYFNNKSLYSIKP